MTQSIPHPGDFVPLDSLPGDQEACLRAASEIAEQKIDIEALTGHPIEIKPAKSRGFGVYAKRHFAPGEVVLSSEVRRAMIERTKTSFEIRPGGRHAELTWPAWRINHACRPNCGIRDNAAGAYDFVAGPDGIAAGEEILTHYGMHEWRSVAVDQCACGAPDCQGRALGWGELSPQMRTIFAEAYGVANHLAHPTIVRGLVIGIELWGCAKHPADEKAVTSFVETLTANHVGAYLVGPTHAKHYGTSPMAGWTWMQMIDASSLTGHHYEETGQAWIDLVTCRPCDADAVARWCAEYWSAAGFNVTVSERA